MRSVCIIPARWGSTRFPGKPLAPIVGSTGKAVPLIARTLDVAIKAGCFDDIYVATDDMRISAALNGWAITTKDTCRNGTERVAQVADILGLGDDTVIVNLQGDSVLTPPSWLDTVVSHMARHPLADVATLIYPRRADEAPSPGDVEALVTNDLMAMYFTRGPMQASPHGRFQHFGIYAYTRMALAEYVSLDPTRREEAEQLEQLRFLENGIGIECIVPDAPGGIFPEREVNYPNDIAAVEEVLKQWNIE